MEMDNHLLKRKVFKYLVIIVFPPERVYTKGPLTLFVDAFCSE